MKQDTLDQVKIILIGIDCTETESDCGWWETSEQAEFGKCKLDELLELLNKKLRED